MTTMRPMLNKEDFYAQFHGQENPHHHSIDHPTTEWWEHPNADQDMVGPPVSYARGGKVGYAKGGSVPHTPHPATRIPGVHIITAGAGEPIFHGEL